MFMSVSEGLPEDGKNTEEIIMEMRRLVAELPECPQREEMERILRLIEEREREDEDKE